MANNYFLQSIGQRVKRIIIQELINYFRDVSTLSFPGSVEKMPLIREAYGIDIRAYPIVFVKIVNVTPQPIGLGNDYVQDVWSDDQTTLQKYMPGTEAFRNPVEYRRRVIAERYGEIADIAFNIQIWGDTTPVRNRISDEVMSAFKRYQREALERQGIVLQNISEGEETDYPLNDTTHVFVANINLTVNAELYYDVPVSCVTAVQVRNSPNAITNPDNSYIIEESS